MSDASDSQPGLGDLVERPWGTFEGVARGEGYQVKRIEVHPGRRLSLQRHAHRAEHWVVVQGHALVTCDNQQVERKADEWIYIPLGAVHRLENIGDELLLLVEVQIGARIDEDDIERLEDDFGRVPD